MSTKQTVSLVLFFALSACVSVTISDGSSEGEEHSDETATSDGDPGSDDGLDETGDGDGDGDGFVECGPLDCDDDGRCWDWQPGWGAWAQSITPSEIDDAVEAGVLLPTDDPTCWAYTDGASSCVEWVEPCSLLIGRPLEELAVVGADECDVDYQGAWEWSMPYGGDCWGLFSSNVAVRLRPL